MKTNKTLLVQDLQKIGLVAGDVVLVHASYKAIGDVEGSVKAVIDALLEVVGVEGTLFMPSFARGQQYGLASSKRVFEVQSTPSEMGAITEIFRTQYPTKRSLHPTHSLSGLGKHATAILADHEKCLVSVGLGSPFEKLQQLNGKILLLGVGHDSNTFLHYVENTLGAPTLSSNRFTMQLIDYDCKLRLIDTHPHLPGLPRNYQRLNEELPATVQNIGSIGQAKSYLVKAQALYEYLKPKLANNSTYLIKPFQP